MTCKRCLRKVIRISACLIMGMSVLFSTYTSRVYASTYSDAVGISEDTYNTLIKGTTVYNGVDYAKKDGYNPLYYFLNYADLRAAYGADPAKLVEHWAIFGRNEKRTSNTQLALAPQANSSKKEYVVPSNQKTKTKKDGMVVIPQEIHSNGGMNRRQETEARSVALQLAQNIYNQVTTNGGGTQIEMVCYATGIVKAYLDIGTFTTEGKLYRTAYGVFIAHEYSSAGATRALGLILDYLNQLCQADKDKEYPPLQWVHVNANTWDDQWCQIVCDNHEAYADAIVSQAGYGKHPNQGGSKQDVQSYYQYATENDIINTRPPYVDGDYKITENQQKNQNPMSGQKPEY
ncbi:hypothetical protein [Butyrivibrio sp. YAB3001]|uniref:hypothetical protein n=1 Tax=Butyrivibrio sp. YAB3001 TaxID=1520812 RepID=UPI0008F61762|nr:hypothetical protein [Butyrivibrio sp. YAB3001]SFC41806.1 hypothetical protein SAMN02910398_02209 [Butyrivibrio sp. YAB3001]